MGQIFSATSGLTACAAAASVKVAIQLATGSAELLRIKQWDVMFNGTTSTEKPVKVELVKTTGASSGGSTYTALKVNGDAYLSATSIASGRINDTTDGSSPTIQMGYLVPATSGLCIQYPLGCEPAVGPSEFWEIRITLQSGAAANDYLVNVQWEE
jgi:hypothetical protein